MKSSQTLFDDKWGKFVLEKSRILQFERIVVSYKRKKLLKEGWGWVGRNGTPCSN